jgi:hypothetical protein
VLKLLRQQQGSIAVLTALAFTVVMGCAALAIDAGYLYLTRAQLATMADAAALAGVQELPGNTDAAVTAADDYARSNGLNTDTVITNISDSNTTLTVDTRRTVELFFARIFGPDSAEISVAATARVIPLSGAEHVVPFGVVKQDFMYGATYNLKLGGGAGYNGNFGALALGGTGANNYEDNIKYGYAGKLQILQWQPLIIDTETGDMSGPTTSGVNYRLGLRSTETFATVTKDSPRIVVVPVIDSLEGNGQHEVEIVGFAAFYLEGAGGSGNDNYVYGNFMQAVMPGDTSGNVGDYGLYGARLIR